MYFKLTSYIVLRCQDSKEELHVVLKTIAGDGDPPSPFDVVFQDQHSSTVVSHRLMISHPQTRIFGQRIEIITVIFYYLGVV